MRLTRLVSSTKLTERDFWNRSLLGKSLLAFPAELRPELWIRFENTGKWGLPEIYNRAIESCPDNRHLLFVHDDVFLHDVFLQHRIAEALGRAEVVGLAGSLGSDLSQPSWCLAFDSRLKPIGWQHELTQGPETRGSGPEGRSKSPSPEPRGPLSLLRRKGWQRRAPSPPGIVLSGAVSHISRYHDPAFEVGVLPKPNLSLYGALPARCDLLDGLFLAVHGVVARDWGVRFDEQLRFHLYDLDFCRTARSKGLRLSTWPILVSHGSGGNFDSEEFRTAARLYLEKWQPKTPANENVPLTAPLPEDAGDFTARLPQLVGCGRCNGILLPDNWNQHKDWHAEQDRQALEELQNADSGKQQAASPEQNPNPEFVARSLPLGAPSEGACP